MQCKAVLRNPRSRLIRGMISTDNQSSTEHDIPGLGPIRFWMMKLYLKHAWVPAQALSILRQAEYTGLTKKILSTPLRLHDQMWNAWILQVKNAQSRKRASLCERVKLNTYTAHESFLAAFVFAVDKAGPGTQIKKERSSKRSGLQSSLPYLKIIIPASTQVQLIHVTTWKIYLSKDRCTVSLRSNIQNATK